MDNIMEKEHSMMRREIRFIAENGKMEIMRDK